MLDRLELTKEKAHNGKSWGAVFQQSVRRLTPNDALLLRWALSRKHAPPTPVGVEGCAKAPRFPSAPDFALASREEMERRVELSKARLAAVMAPKRRLVCLPGGVIEPKTAIWDSPLAPRVLEPYGDESIDAARKQLTDEEEDLD